MSTAPGNDPRLDQAAVTDESLLAVHEKLLGRQKDEQGHYKLLPLNLLFIFSGLIFFAGTYLNRYSGEFNPGVFNENVVPSLTKKDETPTQLTPEQVIAMGQKLYNNAACNACHQVNGAGVPPMFPPLAGSEWVTGSEERVIRIVLHGLQGPITVKGQNYGAVPMPAFGRVAGSGYNWRDDQVAAVLTYIRQEWGNQAGPISAEKVTEVRTKEGNRPAWTAEELMKLP